MPHIFTWAASTPAVVIPAHTNILLLHGDNSLADSSGYGHSLTRNVNVTYDTSRYMSGSASMSFVSSTTLSAASQLSYGVGAESALGTGDFTLEAWVYPFNYSSAASRAVLDFRKPATNGLQPSIFLQNTTGKVQFFTNNTTLALSANAPTLNTWTHIAWVRSNGTSMMFINGQLETSFADSNNYAATTTIFVGTNAFYSTSPQSDMAGLIDEVRCVAGTAMYTSNFTPSATLT